MHSLFPQFDPSPRAAAQTVPMFEMPAGAAVTPALLDDNGTSELALRIGIAGDEAGADA